MKRFTLILTIWLAGLGAVKATTYYVDAGCITNGNGTTITCGASGPKNSIANAFALTFVAGDHLQIRGPHDGTHGGAFNNSATQHKCAQADTPAADCSGTTWDGINSTDLGQHFYDNRGSGAAGNNIIIEPYGYTTTGAWTQEPAILQASGDPGTWTQCVWSGTCDCGVIGDGSQTACEQTWYINPTPGNMGNAEGAVKNDGGLTFAVRRKADLTNAHTGAAGICAGCTTASCASGSACNVDADCTGYSTDNAVCVKYQNTTCSTATWMHCEVDSDCPLGGTCSSTSAEIDSYTDLQDTPTGVIWVRYGSTSPLTSIVKKPYVIWAGNQGQCFAIRNANYITVRGFICRHGHGPGMEIAGTGFGNSSNITYDDNIITMIASTNSGGDYGILHSAHTGADENYITNNNISYLGSEMIHGCANASDAVTALHITNNFFRNAGDSRVLGPAGRLTPAGMILSDSLCGAGASGATPGTYTGSEVRGNLFSRMQAHGKSHPYAIRLENHSAGWTISDNIIDQTDSEAINGDVNIGNTTIFNNLIMGWGGRSAGQGGISLSSASTYSLANLSIFNNTLVDTVGFSPGIFLNCNSGTCTGGTMSNNIFYNSDATGKQVANISMAGGLSHTNNLYKSVNLAAGNTLVGIDGTNKTCALVTDLEATAKCLDPVFVDTTTKDYHIQTSSPAKDAGTSTGMPAGKTRSLNNPLASRHALPQYNGIPQVGSAWDIGACEYRKRRYYSITEFEWKRPDPWRITNAAFLRLKKEIEN